MSATDRDETPAALDPAPYRSKPVAKPRPPASTPSKQCKNCGLINPGSAVRCDCGFDFRSEAVVGSYLAPRHRTDGGDGGWFSPERKLSRVDRGTGFLIMGAAAAWFVLGLMADQIFFYPPILFCIGLYAVVRRRGQGG